MKNQINVGNQNTQQIGQNPTSQSVQIPLKPKVNYWMITIIVLLLLLSGTVGLYFFNLSNRKGQSMQRQPKTPIVPLPTQEPVPVKAWKQISNDWYKYSFEVPTAWVQNEEGATPDRLMLFSDPAVAGQVGPMTLPNGLMKLDFGADPAGKGELDLAGANQITVADRPAWIVSEEGGEAAGPSTFSTTVYILGAEYQYTLGLYCIPPSGAGAKAIDTFTAECRKILDHILETFQIMP